MDMAEFWNLGMPFPLILIVVLLGVIPATLYPVIMAFLKWNKTPIGRAMMFKGIALLLVFFQALIGLALGLGREGWWPWVILVVDAWLTFAVWYQFTVIVQTLLEKKRKKQKIRKPIETPDEPE